jgi:hypothetical protein
MALWAEYRLRAFTDRAPRRIFGSKRVEITKSCRNLRNEKLQGFAPLQVLLE